MENLIFILVIIIPILLLLLLFVCIILSWFELVKYVGKIATIQYEMLQLLKGKRNEN